MRRLAIAATTIFSSLLLGCSDPVAQSERVDSSGELLLVATSGEWSVMGVDLRVGDRVGRWFAKSYPQKVRTSPSGQRVAVSLPGATWLRFHAENARSEIDWVPATAKFINDLAFIDENTVVLSIPAPGMLIVDYLSGDSLGFIAAPVIADDGEPVRSNYNVFQVVPSPRNAARVWGLQTVTQSLVEFDVVDKRVVRIVRDGLFDQRERWRGIRFTPDGREMWLWTSSGVMVRDPDTGAFVRHVPRLDIPDNLVFSRSGDLVYTSYARGRIRVADARTGEVSQERHLQGEIADMEPGGDDVLYVALPVTGEWARDGVLIPSGFGVVLVLDGRTLEGLDTISAGRNPKSIRAVSLSR